MKISIITIVLNDKYNIEKTISSVLNQNIELEYILIDGGSTDGTLDIIKKYKDKIDILLSEKDDGIADAFNKGITIASGKIIGIVNSGDFLELEALKRVQQAFTDNIDVIYGNVQYWKNFQKEYCYKADHKHLSKFMSLNHPAVFVKKSVYNRYGVFNKAYPHAMDYELMLRFYINGVKFIYIDYVLSNMSLGGISDVNWRQAYKEVYLIRESYMGCSFRLYLEYRFHIFKRNISNILSIIGLDEIKSFYRQYCSTIKKYR